MKLWLDKLIPFWMKLRETPDAAAERAMQKHKDPGNITYLADGFIISLDEKEHRVSWEEIDQVNAYKIDLMTTDEICVQISIGDKCFVLTESTPGFDYWLTKMAESLEHINADWYAQVTQNPFEAQHTKIYQRV